MSHGQRLAREEAITDALRVTDIAIGDEPPTPQALRIIEALKRMRDGKPVRIAATVDYMERVQSQARAAWKGRYRPTAFGEKYDATAGIDTPLGCFRAVVWKRIWASPRGPRIAWAGEYYLDDEPITVAEIKAAGLARRPTTRNRQKKRTAS